MDIFKHIDDLAIANALRLHERVHSIKAARSENPPFGRGDTLFGGVTTASSSDGTQMEGKEWIFEDVDPVNKTQRTNLYVTCRAVRNNSGGALLPKRLANFDITPNSQGVVSGQIDGYSSVLAQRAYPIDEFLPTAGVAANDIFWVVIKGPAVVLTDLASLSPAIAIGDKVVAQTAATSGATTAGRVVAQDITGATTPLANMIQNYVGTAITGATTTQTGASILVDVGKF